VRKSSARWSGRSLLHPTLFVLALASSSVPAASIADAEADMRTGRYENALATVIPAAKSGDRAAQYLLAAAYMNGTGVRRDVNEGVKWMERSAALGYGPALADLGAFYLTGRYVPRDIPKAVELLSKAAAQKDPAGHYNLGVVYRDGLNGLPDPKKAEYHFRESAENGYVLAQYGLARIAYDRQDYQLAAKWYEKAGEQGDFEALYNLGYMYHEGQGVTRDYRKARELFYKSADLSRYDRERRGTKPMDMLGTIYRDGKGVPKNLVEAYKWYLLAASQGHPTAAAHAKEVGQFLTPQQVDEARQRASAFAKRQ